MCGNRVCKRSFSITCISTTVTVWFGRWTKCCRRGWIIKTWRVAMVGHVTQCCLQAERAGPLLCSVELSVCLSAGSPLNRPTFICQRTNSVTPAQRRHNRHSQNVVHQWNTITQTFKPHIYRVNVRQIKSALIDVTKNNMNSEKCICLFLAFNLTLMLNV